MSQVSEAPSAPRSPPPRRRHFLPRFSLRTLLIAVLAIGGGVGLWWHWAPWVKLLEYSEQPENRSDTATVRYYEDLNRLILFDRERLYTWNAFTGDLEHELALEGMSYHGDYESFLFFKSRPSAPSGELLVYSTGEMKAVAHLSCPANEDARGWTTRTFRISKDANWLAAIDNRNRLLLWDVETWTLSKIFAGDPGKEHDFIRFANDGARIAMLGDDPGIIWDVATGRKLAELPKEFDLSPDLRSYLDLDSAPVRVVDSESGIEMAVIRGAENKEDTSWEFADGDRIFAIEAGLMKIFDARTGALVGELRHDNPKGFWFQLRTTDNRCLLKTTSEGAVEIWDLVTCKLRKTLVSPGDEFIDAVRVSKHPTQIFTVTKSGQCQVVDSVSDARILSFHVADIENTTASDGAPYFFDGYVSLWRAGHGAIPPYHNEIRDAAYGWYVADTLAFGELRFLETFSDGNRLYIATWNPGEPITCFRLRRPDIWYGFLWLPEFWLTFIFLIALLWSLRRDFKTLRAVKTA